MGCRGTINGNNDIIFPFVIVTWKGKKKITKYIVFME